MWCGHGRDTPGKDSLCWWEGLSPWISWFVTSQGWFGARFGPTLCPQSLLSSWVLPGWGKSLRGAPEKAHLGWHGPLGQPSVPSLGTHGWGQRWRWGDPAVPGLLGDGAVISPQNGVCGHLHGAHQCHTDRDGVLSGAATVTVEGPGFSWAVEGLGFTGNAEGPGSGFTWWQQEALGLQRGSQLPSPPEVGSPQQGCSGLKPTHPSMQRDKSPPSLTRPCCFPSLLPTQAWMGLFPPLLRQRGG